MAKGWRRPPVLLTFEGTGQAGECYDTQFNPYTHFLHHFFQNASIRILKCDIIVSLFMEK